MTTQPNCKARIKSHLQGRLQDLEKLFTAYQEGNEDKYIDDIGTFAEYGLAVDYVAPGTFENQKHGYFRYQLSWGGPSEEFRFYLDERLNPTRIEYWFLDWFDGAKLILSGKAYALMAEIYEFFNEIGTVQVEIDKATRLRPVYNETI
jgi:hypothetical protein